MIWLIGNKGMLGTELSLLLEKNKLPFVGTDREVDITDAAALSEFVNMRISTSLNARDQDADMRISTSLNARNQDADTRFERSRKARSRKAQESDSNSFTWIINCAAYTAVDKAEDDADNCRRLNTLGAANIAACAKDTGARFIHISTDYVFDGRGIIADSVPRPYREDDTTNPIGVYGLTKRDGELAVMAANERSYIIRTAWLYGKHGNNFVNTMLRLMNERDEVKVVNDQRGSPTWAFDLAQTIILLIRSLSEAEMSGAEMSGAEMSGAEMSVPYGVYHFTDEGNITWFDFAVEIYRQGRELGLIKKDCDVKPCASAEFPAKVKRPAFSVLDKSKIKAALGIEIPAWDKSLTEFIRDNANFKP